MTTSKKKIYYYLIGTFFLLLFFIVMLFRSCNSNPISHKTFYIAYDKIWYDLDLRGKDQNMSGFISDMLQAISTEEKFRANVVESSTYALFPGLNSGIYDGVFSTLTPSPQNREFAFSDVIYRTGRVLIVPIGSTVNTFDDLKHKVIGIESSSLQTFSIPETFDTALISYDSAVSALESLDNNKIDGVILDALRAYVYTHGYYAGRLKVVNLPLSNAGMRLITKNEPEYLEFLKLFNEGLRKIKENGVFEDLIDQWGLLNTDAR